MERVCDFFFTNQIEITQWKNKLLHGVQNDNPYLSFIYPQRLLIGLVAGIVISFWVILGILIYIGVWLIPFIRAALNVAGYICTEIKVTDREYFCSIPPGIPSFIILTNRNNRYC